MGFRVLCWEIQQPPPNNRFFWNILVLVAKSQLVVPVAVLNIVFLQRTRSL